MIQSHGTLSLVKKRKNKPLTTEDQALKSEIIHCLDIVDSNCSFYSADFDNEK